MRVFEQLQLTVKIKQNKVKDKTFNIALNGADFHIIYYLKMDYIVFTIKSVKVKQIIKTVKNLR